DGIDAARRAVGEYTGIADIDAGLASELGAETDGVKEPAEWRLVDEVGLVEDVVAIGDVVVGAEIEKRVGGIDTAVERAVGRIDVLIILLVVGGDGAIPYREPVAEVVVDDGHSGLHRGNGLVQGRTAKEDRVVTVRSEWSRGIEARSG